MQYIQRITLGLALGMLATVAYAADVTLTWDAPDNAAGVAGYHLYSGGASEAYTQHVDVGLKTTWTGVGIAPGSTTYFAVLAYDAEGRVSAFSNEISILVPLPSLDAPRVRQAIVTFTMQKKAATATVVQPRRTKSKK